MNALATFWANHGTKLLGTIIAINSGIAGGAVALPPPLNTHSAVLVPWAVFVNFILGFFVVARGLGNTTAIAAAQTAQAAQLTAAAPTLPAAARPAPAPAPAPAPRTHGFARVQLLGVITVLGMLAACASLGLTTPQTPQQGIAYAYSGVTAALTTLASLTTSGVIGSADSIKANNAILSVKGLIDQANSAATSSAPLATTLLTTATADLAQISLYLTCRQQKGTTCQLP
jgi:hypothetical protein